MSLLSNDQLNFQLDNFGGPIIKKQKHGFSVLMDVKLNQKKTTLTGKNMKKDFVQKNPKYRFGILNRINVVCVTQRFLMLKLSAESSGSDRRRTT